MASIVLLCGAASGTLASALAADKITVKSVSVASDGSLYVSPSAEVVPATPGKTVLANVLIENRSAENAFITLSLGEVIGSDADTVVEINYDAPGGAADWASLPDSSFTLQPSKRATVPVRIRVPRSAPSGSQAFSVGVTRSPESSSGSSGGAGIDSVFRQAAIFIVDLPGDAPQKTSYSDLAIGHVSTCTGSRPCSVSNDRVLIDWPWSEQKVQFRGVVTNDGTRIAQSRGTLTIDSKVFGGTRKYELPPRTVYPRGANAWNVTIKSLPSFAILDASVTFNDDAGVTRETVGQILVVPWWVVALGALAIGALMVWALVWLWRRRQRAFLIDEYQRDHDDT